MSRHPLPAVRSLRDFMTFEQHVATARARRGAPVPAEWYEGPTFYYGSVETIYADGDDIAKPPWTDKLDFELELACVVGTGGMNILAEQAEQHIAGYTIMNDWSARDVQRTEMAIGLGPSKSKDFATSLGPHLVSSDALAGSRVVPGLFDLEMVARVNGRELSRGNARDMRWSFAELVAHASRDCPLQPGDVLGSGTVGTGCLLELGPDVHPWLSAGDIVELEIEHLGVLRNTIVDGSGVIHASSLVRAQSAEEEE